LPDLEEQEQGTREKQDGHDGATLRPDRDEAKAEARRLIQKPGIFVQVFGLR
jgi:hypothetical protein